MSPQIYEDFFGQFIKKNVRVLHKQDVQRFIDRLFILCPECFRQSLLVPTSDDYLICAFCNIHWDLLQNRPTEINPDIKIDSRLRPDGSLYRRKVAVSGQLQLEGLPF
jgi:hypothetical protein